MAVYDMIALAANVALVAKNLADFNRPSPKCGALHSPVLVSAGFEVVEDNVRPRLLKVGGSIQSRTFDSHKSFQLDGSISSQADPMLTARMAHGVLQPASH